MTEMATLDGEIVTRPRVTTWSRYPLPPDTGRFQPSWNHYKQYTLPHPTTGREAAFSRATTIAKVLDDTYNLDKWVIRKIVSAVLDGVKTQMKLSSTITGATDHEKAIDATMGMLWIEDRDKQQFNSIIEHVDNLQGGSDATEFGTAVHAWAEAVDLGIVRPCDVPDVFSEHVRVYRELLRVHALLPVPEFIERIVMHDSASETIVGTLDRLFRVMTTGTLVLGDVKTTKADSLEFGILAFCIQLAIYRYASKMLSLDGKTWGPMPQLDGETAYLIHLPNDDAQRAACLAVDTKIGVSGMKLALAVRGMRRTAKQQGLQGVIPVPSPEALRWADARHDIQDITSVDELPGLWETYKDVWTDDLTDLGRQIASLITESELVS